MVRYWSGPCEGGRKRPRIVTKLHRNFSACGNSIGQRHDMPHFGQCHPSRSKESDFPTTASRTSFNLRFWFSSDIYDARRIIRDKIYSSRCRKGVSQHVERSADVIVGRTEGMTRQRSHRRNRLARTLRLAGSLREARACKERRYRHQQ